MTVLVDESCEPVWQFKPPYEGLSGRFIFRKKFTTHTRMEPETHSYWFTALLITLIGNVSTTAHHLIFLGFARCHLFPV